MTDGALLSLQIFWARNGLTKTQFYYLERIGRAPATIALGSKKMVSPEAEAAWRKEMAERPVTGSLRKLALEADSAAAA